jgi:hypothetical protein
MRQRITATFILAIVFAATLAAQAGARGAITRLTPDQRFYKLTDAGGWSFFGDPRSVQVGGRIFTGWTTMGGRVQVSQFDPASGETTVKTLGPQLSDGDDHENPSLLVRGDGRLMAFYSPHSGRLYPTRRASRLYYRTTVNPADISSWTPYRTIPTNTFDGHLGYTYPNPVPLGGGKIFLTWRGGDWLPAIATFDGARWSRARGMVYSPHPRRPYVKTAPGNSHSVLIGYNQDNPRQTRTNTYFMRYVPGYGYFRAGGAKIGPASARIAAQRGDVVAWYGQNGRTWVMDVAEDSDGSPVVLYAAGDRFTEMYYYLARYQAGSWTRTRIVGNGFNGGSLIPASYHYYPSAGASLDHTDPNVVYLSRAVGSQLSMRVETWRLKLPANLSGGWDVTRNSPREMNCFRPVGVRYGAVGDVAMMCGAYFSWLNFPTGVYLARPRR